MAALSSPVVVQRLILLVLVGAAATFGTVTWRHQHDHQVKCQDAKYDYYGSGGTTAIPKGC